MSSGKLFPNGNVGVLWAKGIGINASRLQLLVGVASRIKVRVLGRLPASTPMPNQRHSSQARRGRGTEERLQFRSTRGTTRWIGGDRVTHRRSLEVQNLTEVE